MDQEKKFRYSIVLSCQATRFEAATFQGDFENNLTKVAKLGYGGVELAIRSPHEMDYRTLYSLLDRTALLVPAIGTGQAWGEEHLSFTDPDGLVREQAVQRVLDHIPSAAHLKAHIIIGLLRGKIQPGITRVQAEEWLVIALQQCAKAADSEGVSLCLEPINRYETSLITNVDSGLEMIERVGANNFGLLLDTFHMNIEEADICAAIRKAGSHIFHFHVADSNRWHPGAGHINFKEILQTLLSIGYNGFISGEFLPVPDAITGAERGIQFLNNIQDKIKI